MAFSDTFDLSCYGCYFYSLLLVDYWVRPHQLGPQQDSRNLYAWQFWKGMRISWCWRPFEILQRGLTESQFPNTDLPHSSQLLKIPELSFLQDASYWNQAPHLFHYLQRYFDCFKIPSSKRKPYCHQRPRCATLYFYDWWPIKSWSWRVANEKIIVGATRLGAMACEQYDWVIQ